VSRRQRIVTVESNDEIVVNGEQRSREGLKVLQKFVVICLKSSDLAIKIIDIVLKGVALGDKIVKIIGSGCFDCGGCVVDGLLKIVTLSRELVDLVLQRVDLCLRVGRIIRAAARCEGNSKESETARARCVLRLTGFPYFQQLGNRSGGLAGCIQTRWIPLVRGFCPCFSSASWQARKCATRLPHYGLNAGAAWPPFGGGKPDVDGASHGPPSWRRAWCEIHKIIIYQDFGCSWRAKKFSR
jgi:hypothetical protein